jgi:hypothetical protein
MTLIKRYIYNLFYQVLSKTILRIIKNTMIITVLIFKAYIHHLLWMKNVKLEECKDFKIK